MANETTTAADLIVPEVWAPAIMKAVLAKAALAPLVTTDDTLVGQPGDSIGMPKYDYIGDAEDLTEGVAMETDKLTMTESKVTIKEAGKAIEITDKAILSALGRPEDQAVSQLGMSVARKIDTDIRTAAQRIVVADPGNGIEASSPLIVPTTLDKLDWKGVTSGIALLGDEWDPEDMAGLVIHSLQHVTLMNDPNFIGIDKLGADSVLLRGQVGAIGRVPIIVSDRATKVAGGTVADDVYSALLIRKGALMLAYKRRPIVEKDRDILKRTNVVTTNVHYAAQRVDDRGVVIIKTKIPA